MRALAIVLLAGACSIPEKHFDNGQIDAPAGTIDTAPGTPDASPFDANSAAFPCRGVVPTTAPPNLTFQGQVFDPLHGNMVGGTTIQLWQRGGASPLLTTTADANGHFSLTLPTGGQPVDGYAHFIPPAPYVETWVYPAEKVDKDLTITIFVFQSPDWMNFGGNGSLIGIAIDCSEVASLAGVTVNGPTGSTVTYFQGGVQQAGGPTDQTGLFAITGLIPGATNTVGGNAPDGPPMRDLSFTPQPNSLTQILLMP